MSALPSPASQTATTWSAEVRATFNLGVMLALTQLASIAMTTTDVVMAGWLGPRYLAAESLAGSAVYPFFFFGMGVAAALTPMIAQDIGRGNSNGIRRSVQQGFWVMTALSIPSMIFLSQIETVLVLLGQDPHIAALGGGYVQAVLWSLLPSFGFLVLRNFISAHGRPRSALIIMLAAIGVNGLSNYVLMFGAFGLPRLELVGLGLSTTLVSWLMFVVLLGFCLRDKHFRKYQLLAGTWKSDWPHFRAIFKLGSPIGFGVIAEVGMFALATFLMGLIGADALAGNAVAIQATAVVFMVPMGLSQAVTVRVGLAIGRDNLRDARQVGIVGIGLSIGFAVLSASCLIVFAQDIAELFLDKDRANDQAAITLAVTFITVAAFFQLVDGIQAVSAGALRGMKDTTIPMCMQVISYWGVGGTSMVILAFTLDFQGAGIWAGLVIGLSVASVVLSWRFHHLSKRAMQTIAGLPEAG